MWLRGAGRQHLAPWLEDADPRLFHPEKTRQLWHQTLSGERDGAYTVLAIAMTQQWFQALAQAQKS